MTSVDDCVICPVGTYCSVGSETPTDCAPVGTEYAFIRPFAWAAICVYCVGIPTFYTLLLVAVHNSLVAGESTPFTRALGFLHREYKPHFYWWELMEVLRRVSRAADQTLS